MDHRQIAEACSLLSAKKTRGELGQAIAGLVLTYSPRDLQQLRRNFSQTIRDFAPEYRDTLEKAIAGHLYGTFQALRRMHELRAFDRMDEPLAPGASGYWTMVAAQCSVRERGAGPVALSQVPPRRVLHARAGAPRPPRRDAVSRRRPGRGRRRDVLLPGPGEGERRRFRALPVLPGRPDAGDRVPQAAGAGERIPKTGVHRADVQSTTISTGEPCRPGPRRARVLPSIRPAGP